MSVRGNVLWTPQRLVYSACLVALEQGPLVERFLDAREYLRSVCPHWKLGTSHGGWVEAHKREQERLIPAIKERLRQHNQALSSRAVASRWQALAVDGTNAACPRTRDNQAAMGDTGRPDGIPQLSMTLIQHVDTGLPWDFRVGSSDESERGHLRAMADDLPSDSLLVADAGFIGYDLCRELLEKRRHFLLRVGGNARLLQKLGYQSENDIPRVDGDDVADNKNLKVDVQVHVPDAVHREGQTVYLWPIQQQERREPPIRLRMILVRDADKRPVHLVTSVLEASELAAGEASAIYRARWNIEVCFRTAKQTYEQARLRSRSPDSCYLEMGWVIIGLWMLGLMTAREVVAAGVDPRRISHARARRAVRRARLGMKPRGGPRSFKAALAVCVQDRYTRKKSKTSRNYPRKKKHARPGPPRLKMATTTQAQLAKQLTPLMLGAM